MSKTKLKEVIIGMLQENTGRHMLDSGGASGRHWQINQKNPSDIEYWDNLPLIVPTGFRWGELWGTVNIYHHLTKTLDWDDDIEFINNMYEIFDGLYPSKSFFETRTIFVEWLQKYNFRKKTFGKIPNPEDDEFLEDWNKLFENTEKIEEVFDSFDFGNDYEIINTYNNENILSQDIEYIKFGDLVGVMIHNGADARGGYTKPKFFLLSSDYFYSTYEYSFYCNTCNNYWDNYGGSTFETESEINLKDVERIEYDDLDEEFQKEFDKYGCLLEKPGQVFATEGQKIFEGFDVRLRSNPVYSNTIVFKNGEASCPVCGTGRLGIDKIYS